MDDTKERLNTIAQSESMSEEFAVKFVEEIMSDDEEPAEKGRRLIEAYLAGDVENFVIELTGWRMSSFVTRSFPRLRDDLRRNE